MRKEFNWLPYLIHLRDQGYIMINVSVVKDNITAVRAYAVLPSGLKLTYILPFKVLEDLQNRLTGFIWYQEHNPDNEGYLGSHFIIKVNTGTWEYLMINPEGNFKVYKGKLEI